MKCIRDDVMWDKSVYTMLNVLYTFLQTHTPTRLIDDVSVYTMLNVLYTSLHLLGLLAVFTHLNLVNNTLVNSYYISLLMCMSTSNPINTK